MAPKVSDEYKKQRKQHLQEQAMVCFGDKGFAATTVDDIAKSAGVSKGMLYTYFQSKDEIFLSVLTERTNLQLDELGTEMKRQPTAFNKLLVVMRRYRQAPFSEDQRRWVRIYTEFWLDTTHDSWRQNYLAQRYDRLIKLLSDVIELGQSTHEFRQDVDAKSVAALYWGLCDGIHLQLVQVWTDELQHTLWQAAEEMIVRYVQAK